jgi:hypothetical protein
VTLAAKKFLYLVPSENEQLEAYFTALVKVPVKVWGPGAGSRDSRPAHAAVIGVQGASDRWWHLRICWAHAQRRLYPDEACQGRRSRGRAHVTGRRLTSRAWGPRQQ